jgi:SAM-dependent methyltransferase
VDLVFSNGTFHHIPLDQRDGALAFIRSHLQPGGLLALWENNPWNPGTRWIMSRIPFDRDAITLPPPYARALLGRNGFDVLETTFYFVFPAFLKVARPLEPALSRFPLGAQYLVLARSR